MSMSAVEMQWVFDQINKMGTQLSDGFNKWAKHEYQKRKEIEAKLDRLMRDFYNGQVPEVFLNQDIDFDGPIPQGGEK